MISMRGTISWILCSNFGGYITFVSLGVGKESTSDQLALIDLITKYKIKKLGRDTKVFGIIGNPIGHKKGPIL